MSFTSDLISWYKVHKRNLPFRGTRDPYLLWVSEIILQQTRMEQGLDQYRKFIRRFPDLIALAETEEVEVLKIWQGWGYYSRARNLLESARVIVEKFDGQFPDSFSEIKRLKGVGDYSAASIASLAFDEPIPAVDGNVYRFMARYFGFQEQVGSSAGKKRAVAQAQKLMDKRKPGQFNQAMIEFGALVCKPVNPVCTACIFRDSCYAYQHDRVSLFPLKSKSASIRRRYFHYLVITFIKDGKLRIIINKRTGDDIWKNLYDFPLIETSKRVSKQTLQGAERWKSIFQNLSPELGSISEEFKHTLSHQIILATFYRISLPSEPDPRLKSIPVDDLELIPIPKLISRYVQKYSIHCIPSFLITLHVIF